MPYRIIRVDHVGHRSKSPLRSFQAGRLCSTQGAPCSLQISPKVLPSWAITLDTGSPVLTLSLPNAPIRSNKNLRYYPNPAQSKRGILLASNAGRTLSLPHPRRKRVLGLAGESTMSADCARTLLQEERLFPPSLPVAAARGFLCTPTACRRYLPSCMVRGGKSLLRTRRR